MTEIKGLDVLLLALVVGLTNPEQKLCLLCKSLNCVEDEQHFVFDCPAYSHIRSQHLDLLQHCCTIADFMTLCEPNACRGFLRECFACRKQILSV